MEKTAATIMKAPRKSRECASIPNMVTCESYMIYLASTETVYVYVYVLFMFITWRM